MNSRARGATAVFVWPDPEIAIMAAEAAVEILHRKRLAAAVGDERDERDELKDELAAEHARLAGGPDPMPLSRWNRCRRHAAWRPGSRRSYQGKTPARAGLSNSAYMAFRFSGAPCTH